MSEVSDTAAAEFETTLRKDYSWRLNLAVLLVSVPELPGAVPLILMSGAAGIAGILAAVLSGPVVIRIAGLVGVAFSLFVLVVLPARLVFTASRAAPAIHVGEVRRSRITVDGITVRNSTGSVTLHFADCTRIREALGFAVLIRPGLGPTALPSDLFPKQARAQFFDAPRGGRTATG
ncbi:hypothetical protein ACFOYW_16945 [Gryllotalpicola reticulitermitis]|uniref:PH domain-containing protein n=1 Tax=Gryllotalpicola reticulitermitis TaxID=1184153 RepID=A0ABV8QAU4_9MICO